MEDKNMARVELKEAEVEQIVGGAFNFYKNSAGLDKVYVDGYGAYFCTPNAAMWTIEQTAGNTRTCAEVLNEALALGYFY